MSAAKTEVYDWIIFFTEDLLGPIVVGVIVLIAQWLLRSSSEKRLKKYADELSRDFHAYSYLYQKNFDAFQNLGYDLNLLNDNLIRLSKPRRDDGLALLEETKKHYDKFLHHYRESFGFLPDGLLKNIVDARELIKNILIDLDEGPKEWDPERLQRAASEARGSIPEILAEIRIEMRELIRISEFENQKALALSN